jgi:glutamate racemase
MIGIFDSGYGGLTILDAIKRALPQYSYVYFGDNGHAPYGPKSDEEILTLTKNGVEQLFQQGCELVILGCNTASASALRKLQQEWLPATHPDKKILGIIVPTIEAMEGLAHDTVGVLATQHTVATGVYEIEANKRNMGTKVVQQACNNLAGMIEQYGATDERVISEIEQCVAELLHQIPHPDAVLLGCTHYEFVAEAIAKLLPQSTNLIRQPGIVAASVADYLARHPEIEQKLGKTGETTYFTTGNPEEVSRKSSELTKGNRGFVGMGKSI